MIVFGLVMIFVIVPIQISSSSEYGLDPKFFPEALLWLVVAMGALLVATRLPLPPDPPDREPVLDRHNWLFIGAFAAFLVLGYLAITRIGFIAAGIAMTAALMFALGGRRRNWIELIGVSIVAPVAIHYALYHIFSIQLPAGALFP